MARKKLDDPTQSKRFEDAVRELEAAGALSPTDDTLDKVMAKVTRLRQRWFDEGEDREYPD